MNGVGHYILLTEMIVHTSRSSHHHMRIDLLKRAVFLHSRTTAVAAHNAERGFHGLEYLLNLQGQLARRYQDDSLHSTLGFLEALHQRNKTGQCLARTGR